MYSDSAEYARNPMVVSEISSPLRSASASTGNLHQIRSRNRSTLSTSMQSDPHLASKIGAYYLSNVQSNIPFETDKITPAYGIGDMIAPEMNDSRSPNVSSASSKKIGLYSRPNVSSSSMLLTIKRATSEDYPSDKQQRDGPINREFLPKKSISTTFTPTPSRMSHEVSRTAYPTQSTDSLHRSTTPRHSSPLQKQVTIDLPFTLPISEEEQLDWIRENENLAHSMNPDDCLEWSEYVLRFTLVYLPYLQNYDSGNYDEIDYLENVCETALDKIREYSRAENARALYHDGYTYESGAFDVEVDLQQAWELYSASAKLGYTRSLYRLGVILEDQGSLQESIEYFEQGASFKDSACCWRLALLILEGMLDNIGTYAQQRSRAIELLELSANNADADVPSGLYSYALLNLHEHPGLVDLDAEGLAIPINERRALECFARAAFLGQSSALLRMGAVYEFGKCGCFISPKYSVLYYSAASKQGETEADFALAKWYLNGATDVPVDEDQAFVHAERAAMAGNANAQFLLGYIFESKNNSEQALYWYTEASNNGHVEAAEGLESLKELLKNGESLPPTSTSNDSHGAANYSSAPSTPYITSQSQDDTSNAAITKSVPETTPAKPVVQKVPVTKKTTKGKFRKHLNCVIA
ncbi:1,3-beta-glucan synthase regulatory factor Chf3/Chr4 [Schizosaccharomyces cryophilus OY26]|uniref:1,3-beta-glucan synthase regulatory factor Chf3/Chr4 n=1 Tax=Schizosaccharomyces cryophilus (strain OY26 / ATCC MYA-4695 / CBS 11777 / NBRC 106824 / NRRL Y48691) TaxID=653667 RepID=S9X8K7_SCHCR|nr:1,3-beta-glucan synthase regulatory factor Chf3/Chr4 [Schizosaccharomyces cryophilus OY26]EPY50161.1 1,3-beta-glucan synthase regulatory factor Chf3/Chr4 [Schizosaccharomyces cryophilus OY26]